jgi:hypothetical protein
MRFASIYNKFTNMWYNLKGEKDSSKVTFEEFCEANEVYESL